MGDRQRTLRQLRRERLLTIRALAAAAACSTRTVRLTEQGASIPQPGTIKRLSAALGVEPKQVREFRAAMGLEDGGDER